MRAPHPPSTARRLARCAAPLLLLAVWQAAPEATADEAPGAPPAAPSPPSAEDTVHTLPDVVVEAPLVGTPLRFPAPLSEVPRAVNLVDTRRLRERPGTSALDALDDQLGVWVEKRTAHTSDPVVRGLSGANLLALVNGMPFSTVWGEGGFAGDDLYGKLDPDMLERVEVVRGPSSVLYGSNALGGVLNFVTRRSPFDFTCGGVRTGGRLRLTAAGASKYARVHAETYGASRDLRWLVGATWWTSGDTVDGSGERQDPTGGEGHFQNAVVDVRLRPGLLLGVTYERTDNDPVYRYYRPTQDNANRRDAVALTLAATGLSRAVALADEARLSLSFQAKEDRRRFFDAGGTLLRTGVATWDTAHAGVQLDKRLGRHRLVYGADAEVTWGESPDDEQFTITPVGGTPAKAAPDSTWTAVGLYAQDVWAVAPRLTLTASGRLEVQRFRSRPDAAYTPPGGLDPALDEIDDVQTALVGGLQASWEATPRCTVYGAWSRGFRVYAPRFGATQQGFGVVTPTGLLDPVTADLYEVGAHVRTPVVRAQAAAYVTDFGSFQNLVRGTFQGQDWYDIDGDAVRDANEDVYVTVGNGDAHLYGVELGATFDLCALTGWRATRGWSVGGTFAWNRGQDETNDIPLRHTYPAHGTAVLRYDAPVPGSGPWLEVQGSFAGRFDRIPPDRLANDPGYFEDPQSAASGKRRTWGLPGYGVLDVRAGIDLGRRASLVVGVENVFDRLYRPAHARWDAPGRSFVLALELTF